MVSPLLADVYLQYVFDRSGGAWRKRVAQGDMGVVRVADDVVLGFEHRRATKRFLAARPDRLQPSALELHAEKTRLIEDGPLAIANRKQRGEGLPETLDFLGFTPICERHRTTGSLTVQRQTVRKRMVAKLKALPQWLRHAAMRRSRPRASGRGQLCKATATTTRCPATCGPGAPAGGG